MLLHNQRINRQYLDVTQRLQDDFVPTDALLTELDDSVSLHESNKDTSCTCIVRHLSWPPNRTLDIVF